MEPGTTPEAEPTWLSRYWYYLLAAFIVPLVFVLMSAAGIPIGNYVLWTIGIIIGLGLLGFLLKLARGSENRRSWKPALWVGAIVAFVVLAVWVCRDSEETKLERRTLALAEEAHKDRLSREQSLRMAGSMVIPAGRKTVITRVMASYETVHQLYHTPEGWCQTMRARDPRMSYVTVVWKDDGTKVRYLTKPNKKPPDMGQVQIFSLEPYGTPAEVEIITYPETYDRGCNHSSVPQRA